MKKIIEFLKTIVLSAFVLYGYNLIATHFNMVIPINIMTILIITFLGAPALFALVLFKILVL